MTINIFVLKGDLNGENRSGAFLFFLSGIFWLDKVQAEIVRNNLNDLDLEGMTNYVFQVARNIYVVQAMSLNNTLFIKEWRRLLVVYTYHTIGGNTKEQVEKWQRVQISDRLEFHSMRILLKGKRVEKKVFLSWIRSFGYNQSF